VALALRRKKVKEQLATQQRQTGRPVKLVSAHVLVDRTNEIRDLIARRAYELFERGGYVYGQDVDDWIQAESELLHPCRHEIKESSEAIILDADVPGSFSPEQLKISVEPRRLMVSGETELTY
jgi:HSP20 family molecular chaperone IbpA